MPDRPLPRRAVRAGVLVAVLVVGGAGALQSVSAEPRTHTTTPGAASTSPSPQGTAATPPQAEQAPAQPKAERAPAEPEAEGTPAKPKAEGTPAKPKAERAPAKPKKTDAAGPGRGRGPKARVPAVPFRCDPSKSHGENISAYVHSLPKGPGRGRLVSAAARSDCGKPPRR